MSNGKLVLYPAIWVRDHVGEWGMVMVYGCWSTEYVRPSRPFSCETRIGFGTPLVESHTHFVAMQYCRFAAESELSAQSRFALHFCCARPRVHSRIVLVRLYWSIALIVHYIDDERTLAAFKLRSRYANPMYRSDTTS